TILKDLPTQDAAQIANDTLSAGQSSSLSEIDPIIAAYQGILISLKSLPVPQKLAQNHLNLLNGIATTLSNDQALRKVDADPVQGLSALSLYVSGLQQISTAVSGLQSGFDSANVVLTVAASTNNK
ncbi:MAG: hypothetical protein NTZ38_02045, partial [Candidatus Taylorbacteria bacterium]|nr:hypothetical protein [Candidatus Taylorbacteria bacterium]